MQTFITIAIIVGIFVFVMLVAGIRIDNEYERGVIFRLGRLKWVKGPGIYWIIPFIDQKQKVDLRIRTLDIESQETVTRDSVTIRVNAVLYYQVNKPDTAIVTVKNYEQAAIQTALTSLRNVIGQHNLDEVLNNRTSINLAIKNIVDDVVEMWGLRISSIEMKDVEIPQTMQRAMAKEAEATREKRARIIKASGEFEASMKLKEAAIGISENPIALELRRMQMITEVGAEQNTTTLIMLPSDFVSLAHSLTKKIEDSLIKDKIVEEHERPD